jgi:hypothetical protein
MYEHWVDMDELAREGDEVAGQAVADATVERLREINSERKSMIRTVRAAG